MLHISEFIKNLDHLKPAGNGYRAACPAHQGKDPNLAVWEDETGQVRTKCYSHGCDRKEIIEALGFTLSDILPDRSPAEARKHQKIVNERALQQALVIELLILLQWLDAFYRGLFPEQEADVDRVALAWQRVISAGQHYQQVGL